jgi:hypothetical protein
MKVYISILEETYPLRLVVFLKDVSYVTRMFLPSQRAAQAGWDALFALLPGVPGNWIKGQVTGPVSMGLMLTDQDKRPILYNEWLAEVLTKNTEMQARWQIRQLTSLRPNVLLSIDEPALSMFGSAHISLNSDHVINMLNPVIDAIHEEGALSCVHCCANTDWSLLMKTRVKVINLDAYGFFEGFSLYPHDLDRFLGQGGIICWGIVMTSHMELSGDLVEVHTLWVGYQTFARGC